MAQGRMWPKARYFALHWVGDSWNYVWLFRLCSSYLEWKGQFTSWTGGYRVGKIETYEEAEIFFINQKYHMYGKSLRNFESIRYVFIEL